VRVGLRTHFVIPSQGACPSRLKLLLTHLFIFCISASIRHTNEYLDKPYVRSDLGVDSSVTGNFSMCSRTVGILFDAQMDGLQPTYLYVAALLERKIKTLIYVGEAEWICNWVGPKVDTGTGRKTLQALSCGNGLWMELLQA
jgi:hypothetical protein